MPHESTDGANVEIEHAIALADAALGAAGHDVTDADTRALGRRVAAGTLTGDEAAARILAKLRADRSD